MPDAVDVEILISSAVLLELPFSTSIDNASVADVPILRETSALLASSNIVKSPPVNAVIAWEASTDMTELEAVSPVPANNVATSAIASLAAVPVAPPSKNNT